MQLYNTASRKLEDLQPQRSEQVTIYTCGPTVYDYAHIGHWFTYIRWDLLVRSLRAQGLTPYWVMNITDVGHLVSDADDGEDKLEKGAKREGKSAWDVAKFYTEDFLHELQSLNILEPSRFTKATDHITDQIELIQRLESKGYTYVIDDGIYYDTAKFPKYADFARLDIDELQAGARVSYNRQKRQPTDFALWKFSPKDQQRDMEWWAPWQRPGENSDEKLSVAEPRALHSSAPEGAAEQRTDPYGKYGVGAAEEVTPRSAESSNRVSGSAAEQDRAVYGSWGFPGWHIECSAMAMKYLGDTLDIHTGGIDHIPVHHTNEIAQSEAVTNKPFANLWLHSNHVLIDDSKISKSLGNGIRLKDIEARGISLEAFRLHVLESHYRSQSKFSWDSLKAAGNRLQDLKSMAALRWQTLPALHDHATFSFGDVAEEISNIMANDLHSEAALAYLSEVTKQTLAVLVSNEDKMEFESMLGDIDALLGTRLLEVPNITPEQNKLLADRESARMTNNWKLSDKLRDVLAKQFIGVRDTPFGAIWYPLLP